MKFYSILVKPFNFWLKNTQKKKKPLESKESKDMYPKKAIKIIDIQNITLKLKFQQFRHYIYIWKEKKILQF